MLHDCSCSDVVHDGFQSVGKPWNECSSGRTSIPSRGEAGKSSNQSYGFSKRPRCSCSNCDSIYRVYLHSLLSNDPKKTITKFGYVIE